MGTQAEQDSGVQRSGIGTDADWFPMERRFLGLPMKHQITAADAGSTPAASTTRGRTGFDGADGMMWRQPAGDYRGSEVTGKSTKHRLQGDGSQGTIPYSSGRRLLNSANHKGQRYADGSASGCLTRLQARYGRGPGNRTPPRKIKRRKCYLRYICL
jgi:hypothetical protein